MTTDNSPSQPGSGRAVDLRYVSLLWALPEHAEAISHLHAATFTDAWDAASVSRLISHPGSIALVASAGAPTTLGGFALAQVAADEAEILTLGVIPAWRRKGVANRLVQGLKRGAARGGAHALFLEVAASNEPAISLYAQNGFIEAGRRKGYYAHTDGPAEDAVVMRCELAT